MIGFYITCSVVTVDVYIQYSTVYCLFFFCYMFCFKWWFKKALPLLPQQFKFQCLLLTQHVEFFWDPSRINVMKIKCIVENFKDSTMLICRRFGTLSLFTRLSNRTMSNMRSALSLAATLNRVLAFLLKRRIVVDICLCSLTEICCSKSLLSYCAVSRWRISTSGKKYQSANAALLCCRQ